MGLPAASAGAARAAAHAPRRAATPACCVAAPSCDHHPPAPTQPRRAQANWLRGQGVRQGDVVTLYLPMICELPIAMLACARIGAVHSVVFAGFSADALAQRLQDGK